MVEAYVLIQTQIGEAASVIEAIRKMEGVESAEPVTGPYDVVVRVSGPDVDFLGKLVVSDIQTMTEITRTVTCPIIKL